MAALLLLAAVSVALTYWIAGWIKVDAQNRTDLVQWLVIIILSWDLTSTRHKVQALGFSVRNVERRTL